jgi:integrase
LSYRSETIMARTKLTDASCEKLSAKGGKRTVYFDALTTGLALRVSVDGVRTFCVVYRVAGDGALRKRWLTLGRYLGVAGDGEPLTLAKARVDARAALADAKAGKDPAAEREHQLMERAERRSNTVGAVAEDFLKRHVAALRSAGIAEGVIRRELLGQVLDAKKWTDDRRNPRWRDRPITEITRRDVVKLLEEIVDRGHPYLARLVLAYARKMFRWAIGRDVYGLQASPCADVSAKDHGAPTVPRQVTIANDHLRLIWRAADGLSKPFGPFFKMLILSGQRRNEIARLKWSEIDAGEKVINLPAERMKAKRPHEVPLSEAMVKLLDGITRGKGEYVFSTTDGKAPVSGFGKLKARLDKKVAELHAEELKKAGQGAPKKLPDWRPHDLRRTMRTGLGAIREIAPDVRELVIAHVSSALVRTYDLHSYRTEKRQALELWSQRLARIVDPPAPDADAADAKVVDTADAKVVDLRQRRARTKRASANSAPASA